MSSAQTGIGSGLDWMLTLIAGGKIARQPLDHGFDPRPRRRRPVKALVEETLLALWPCVFADDEITAQVEQDFIQTRFDAQFAKAAAIELSLAIERGHHDRVGGGFHSRLDAIAVMRSSGRP